MHMKLYVLLSQLSELNFELAHQRVQLQGTVAETESRAALMKETMQEKVSACALSEDWSA